MPGTQPVAGDHHASIEARPLMLRQELERLGDTVRYYRELADLSTLDLSRRAGVAEVDIRRIERGDANSTVGRLMKIAQALEVDPWWRLLE
jgi:transcriptional regulator with XRE-family HTH domain